MSPENRRMFFGECSSANVLRRLFFGYGNGRFYYAASALLQTHQDTRRNPDTNEVFVMSYRTLQFSPSSSFAQAPPRHTGMARGKLAFGDGRIYRPASYEEDRTRRNKKTQPASLANWRARSPFCCVPTAWQQFRIVGTSSLLSAQGSMTKLNDKAQ